MLESVHPADQLKPLRAVTEADVRSGYFTRITVNGIERCTLEDHHADAARYTLHAGVPEPVVVQFETAKNLYLYAWYVFRFYPVMKLQAFACLELGLKLRFPGGIPGKDGKSKPIDPNSGEGPGLRKLIDHACKLRLIRNEGFRHWHDLVQRRADQRRMLEDMENMRAQNLDAMEVSPEPAPVTDVDREVDVLPWVREQLPKARNRQAHGSTGLDRNVLGTLELVADILNQVFEPSVAHLKGSMPPTSP